jgi:hypothetical protein
MTAMVRPARARKVVDETAEVRCAQGWGVIREEVWQGEGGEVVRYNLAFICHLLCTLDHGGCSDTTTSTAITTAISWEIWSRFSMPDMIIC